jgi:transcription elongation factor Elf1
MRIKEISSQHRRDFVATLECEHCDHTQQIMGYDDANYHQNVIPSIKCQSCGESAGDNYRALSTKYEEGVQV